MAGLFHLVRSFSNPGFAPFFPHIWGVPPPRPSSHDHLSILPSPAPPPLPTYCKAIVFRPNSRTHAPFQTRVCSHSCTLRRETEERGERAMGEYRGKNKNLLFSPLLAPPGPTIVRAYFFSGKDSFLAAPGRGQEKQSFTALRRRRLAREGGRGSIFTRLLLLLLLQL